MILLFPNHQIIIVNVVIYLTRDKFKLIHSELIMQVQLIENDLRLIYAAMRKGNFDDNVEILEKADLGKIITELKKLDYSDGNPDLSEKDYKLLNQIREIRNYWCHQSYIDYVYINDDDNERKKKFQQIANRLHYDENRTWDLHERIENLRLKMLKSYKRRGCGHILGLFKQLIQDYVCTLPGSYIPEIV